MLRNDQPEEAIDVLDDAIEQQPEYDFAYVDRSRAKMAIDDYRGAEADLTEALELNPDFYWHYLDRGRVRLLGIGDTSGALDDFNKAISIDPDYFYAYIYRGGIYDRQGKRTQAIDDYLKVLEQRPDYYHVYGSLGVLLYMEEEWQRAKQYLKKAFEYDDEMISYPLLTAVADIRDENPEKAKEYLSSVLGSFQRDTLSYDMARFLMENGYDGYITNAVSKESDKKLKTKMLYYLAVYNYIKDRVSIAHKYFMEVEDKGYVGMIEKRLASWELERFER